MRSWGGQDAERLGRPNVHWHYVTMNWGAEISISQNNLKKNTYVVYTADLRCIRTGPGGNHMHNTDERYMREAIKQAKKAYALNEVPIGCVIVHEDRIIARGYNKRNTIKSTLGHAEITAIKKAGKVIGDWRLEECTMYITLEPCPMCAGAIVQARIPKVVIGAMNPKAGCAGSVVNLLQMEGFNHRVDVTYDVLQEECSRMLQEFFRELRKVKSV